MVGACPPENIGWQIPSSSHDYSLMGNWLCDNTLLLNEPSL